MLGLPDVAVGAIVASIIAGLVSLLGLIISKEQKTSEFRQSWIDALRMEVSKFIAHVNAIHGAAAASPRPLQERWNDARADFVGANEAAANIRLRLNPNERLARGPLKTIEEVEKLLAPGTKVPDYRALDELEKNLVEQTAAILKSEWNRVRRGERVYQIAKYLALATIIIALLGGVFVVARISPPSNHSIAPKAIPTPK